MSRLSEIDNLEEGVILNLECLCGDTISDWRHSCASSELAEKAYTRGWRVKQGHTFCPDCIKKRKHLKL